MEKLRNTLNKVLNLLAGLSMTVMVVLTTYQVKMCIRDRMQTISVQRHFTQIGTNAQNAAGFHLVPNPFQLRLADPEMELLDVYKRQMVGRNRMTPEIPST